MIGPTVSICFRDGFRISMYDGWDNELKRLLKALQMDELGEFKNEMFELTPSNLYFIPSGFELKWCGYQPNGDGFINQNLGLDDFRDIVGYCIGSLQSDIGLNMSEEYLS